MRSRLILLASLAIALAGCNAAVSPSPSAFVVGPQPSGALVPVIANGSGNLAVGPVRLLFLLVDANTKPVSSADKSVQVTLTAPAGDDSASGAPLAPVKATFVDGGNGDGYYIADVSFATAGDWRATFDITQPSASPQSVPLDIQVGAKPITIQVGQKAPSVKTPTAADVGGTLAEITTDPTPDPRFYQLSEDKALAEHKPFVLVFATPKFCTSRLCGPALDRVKALAAKYPGLTFINVEPYQMRFTDGQLQPVLDANGQLQTNDASNAFAITAEPWIFTVDRNGVIQGSLESVFADPELTAAIDKIK